MQKLILILKASALGAATLLMLAGAFLGLRTAEAVQRLDTSSAGIVAQLSATLNHLNKPCKGSGADKADNCGTLALAGQTMVNAGDLIKRSQKVEDSESKLLDAALPPLLAKANVTLDNLGIATADLHPLLTTTTERVAALSSIEENLGKLSGDIEVGSKTMFMKFDETTDKVNALVENPDVPIILHHFAGMTTSVDAMLFTANKVETKATYNYLNPSHNPLKRTWQVVSPFLLPTAQIAAAAVR